MSNAQPDIAYTDEPHLDHGVHHPYTAYNQGFDAAELLMPIGRNPYQQDTREHDWWRDGWFDGNENVHVGFPKLAI